MKEELYEAYKRGYDDGQKDLGATLIDVIKRHKNDDLSQVIEGVVSFLNNNNK